MRPMGFLSPNLSKMRNRNNVGDDLLGVPLFMRVAEDVNPYDKNARTHNKKAFPCEGRGTACGG